MSHPLPSLQEFPAEPGMIVVVRKPLDKPHDLLLQSYCTASSLLAAINIG
jgi:hypothetical protein